MSKIEIEIEYGDNYSKLDLFEIEADGYNAYDPGRTSGPPERCYPPEGGFCEIGNIRVKRAGSDKWEDHELSVLLERYAEYKDFQSDPANSAIPSRMLKSAIQKAEEDITSLLYETCERDAAEAYEGYMEARYDAMRDD